MRHLEAFDICPTVEKAVAKTRLSIALNIKICWGNYVGLKAYSSQYLIIV